MNRGRLQVRQQFMDRTNELEPKKISTQKNKAPTSQKEFEARFLSGVEYSVCCSAFRRKDSSRGCEPNGLRQLLRFISSQPKLLAILQPDFNGIPTRYVVEPSVTGE